MTSFPLSFFSPFYQVKEFLGRIQSKSVSQSLNLKKGKEVKQEKEERARRAPKRAKKIEERRRSKDI